MGEKEKNWVNNESRLKLYIRPEHKLIFERGWILAGQIHFLNFWKEGKEIKDESLGLRYEN